MGWPIDLTALQTVLFFWLGLCLDAGLKSLLIALLSFAGYLALKRASASFRHLVLTLTFICLAVLPFGDALLPEWPVPLISVNRAQAYLAPLGGWSGVASGLLAIWLGGFLLVSLRFLTALAALREIRRSARPVFDPDWLEERDELSEELGIRGTVRLLITRRLTAAVCVGVFRSTILLPVSASDWSPAHRRTILRHELNHVRRRDNLTNHLALAVCAFYWFNPIAWWALKSLRVAREGACDDAVINSGVKPSDYVSILLAAVPVGKQAFPWARISQVSAIKLRLLTILNPRVNRVSLSRSQLTAAGAGAALLFSLVVTVRPWIVSEFSAGVTGALSMLTGDTGIFSERAESNFGVRTPRNGDRNLLRLASQSPPNEAVGESAESSFGGRAPRVSMVTIGAAANSSSRMASGGSLTGAMASKQAAGLTQASEPWPTSYRYRGGYVASNKKKPKDPPAPKPPGDDLVTVDPVRVREVQVSRIELGHQDSLSSVAADINEAGEVAGTAISLAGDSRPFVWSVESGRQNLPCPGTDCTAVAINGNGAVLLNGNGLDGRSRSWLWLPESGMVDIGCLGGGMTRASDINELDQVIGISQTSAGIEQAFVWSPGSGIMNLGGMGALAINDLGQVVGWAGSYSFFWDGEIGFLRIGEIGVVAKPLHINSAGEVVGYAAFERNTPPRAFLWTPWQGMVDLGLLPGDRMSCAYRISDAGEIFGVSTGAENSGRGVVWSKDGTMRELTEGLPFDFEPEPDEEMPTVPTIPIGSNAVSTLRWLEEVQKANGSPGEESSEPVSVNGRGQIVGNVRSNGGNTQAVVWQLRPVGAEEGLTRLLRDLRNEGIGENALEPLVHAQRSLEQMLPESALVEIDEFIQSLDRPWLPSGTARDRWRRSAFLIREALTEFFFYQVE